MTNFITNTQISGLTRTALVAVEQGNTKLLNIIRAKFSDWNKRAWSDGTLDLDLSHLVSCQETILKAVEATKEYESSTVNGRLMHRVAAERQRAEKAEQKVKVLETQLENRSKMLFAQKKEIRNLMEALEVEDVRSHDLQDKVSAQDELIEALKANLDESHLFLPWDPHHKGL